MTHTNRLINETSPYLLQHAHNPVDWYPWGEVALNKAKEEDKIILVSIGYSACHWCHVMERESFENEATAAIMNTHFINIKIDREERPDLDHIYMDAVQAMTGSGGWPLNVFLTPATKPFFGGTYFPPVKAFNRSSWPEVLQGVVQAWKERKNEIESQAENLTDYLGKTNSILQTNAISLDETEAIFAPELAATMFANIMKSADTVWGGFGKAPKFPQTFTIQYLLQYHYFSGNKTALTQALLSIDKMLEGGIYDHIAGGLARYSTDNEWLAPHFEKMLYDNALLINILCDAYQVTKEKKYEHAIHKTIAFVKEELTNEEGGFYAALDADSEGEEGKYYVWQKAEIEAVLGKDAAIFCEFFDVTEEGNWEEKNILRILKNQEDFVADKKIDSAGFEQCMNECLGKLKAERAKRIKPSLDDKIILSWNALMLAAIAKAATVLQWSAYEQMAIDNFNFIKRNFAVANDSPALHHTWKNNIAKYPAFLDDYAYLIEACLHLYQATLQKNYLEQAKLYAEYTISHFSDEEDLFFYYTQAGQKDILVRKIENYDGAIPSGNAVMASNLLHLSIIFDKADWKERACKMMAVLLPSVSKYPGSFGRWASTLMQQAAGVNEITIVGKDYFSTTREIFQKYFIPNKIIMAAEDSDDAYPMLAAKPKATPVLIYLCKNQACLEPFGNVADFIKTILKIDRT